MSQIVIQTELTAADALACHSTQCGELDVRPTETELASLTDVQRDILARGVASDGNAYGSYCRAESAPRHARRLSVSAPGFAGVVATLDARATRLAADRAERQAHIDVELAELRAGTRDRSPNYSRDVPEAQALWREIEARAEAERVANVLAADAALGDDPAAHIVADEPDSLTKDVLKSAQTYRDGRYQDVPPVPRARAVEALVKARREERAAAYREVCRTYVIHHVPDYTRAAVEGHDVTGIAADHVLDRLRTQLSAVGPIVTCYKDGGMRDCPSADAYAVLDAVQALALDVPGIVHVEGSRLSRVDVSSGSTAWRTCVEVELTWSDGTSGHLFVLADVAGLPEEGEETENED